MSRSTLFVFTLVVVSCLAAYVAYGIFGVGVMEEYEKSKMYFAASVLAFLAYIFMLSMILYALGPESTSASADSPGKIIFDACVKLIPPLGALIIGFYFGASQDNSQQATIDTKVVESAAVSSE